MPYAETFCGCERVGILEPQEHTDYSLSALAQLVSAQFHLPYVHKILSIFRGVQYSVLKSRLFSPAFARMMSTSTTASVIPMFSGFILRTWLPSDRFSIWESALTAN